MAGDCRSLGGASGLPDRVGFATEFEGGGSSGVPSTIGVEPERLFGGSRPGPDAWAAGGTGGRRGTSSHAATLPEAAAPGSVGPP